MLVIGVDVAILGMFAIAYTIGAYVLMAITGATSDEGLPVVAATAVSCLLMVLSYVAMAHVLDAALGTMGW